MNEKNIREELLASLPIIVFRDAVHDIMSGAIAPKTLANLESKGMGPENKLRLGRRVAYWRHDFVEWFLSRYLKS
jgi:hypothetical protein